MLVELDKLKLLMFERTDMPDSVYNEEQKKWVKTGGKTERTTYTFRDEFTNEKLVFLAGNEFRELEGQVCLLQIDIKFDDFGRKYKVALKHVAHSPSDKS